MKSYYVARVACDANYNQPGASSVVTRKPSTGVDV